MNTNTSLIQISQNCADLISDLPEGVITHIFSFLPIKDVVQTCVLSKDWEYKWMAIYCVNIDDSLFPESWRSSSSFFVKFVEGILRNLENVKSFHLKRSCCEKEEFFGTMKWISSVLRKNIESLEMKVSYNHDHEDPILPESLVNCFSLKSLVIDMLCTLQVGVSNYSPKLTKLHLQFIRIFNPHSNTETLVFTFPVLKELVLEDCEWLDVKLVEINAPSLTIFRSETPFESHDEKEDNCLIKIIGELRLREFKAYGGYPQDITMNVSDVVYVDLQFFLDDEGFMSLTECGLRLRKLLRQLSQVKLMCASNVFKAIAQTKREGLPLPRFVQMKKLTAFTPLGIEELLEILHAAPFLKFLVLCMGSEDVDDYDYAKAESMPSCFGSHLVKLNLDYRDHSSSKPSFDLAKFVLRNAVKLRIVEVDGSPYFPAKEIIKELLTFPKGSSSSILWRARSQ